MHNSSAFYFDYIIVAVYTPVSVHLNLQVFSTLISAIKINLQRTTVDVSARKLVLISHPEMQGDRGFADGELWRVHRALCYNVDLGAE